MASPFLLRVNMRRLYLLAWCTIQKSRCSIRTVVDGYNGSNIPSCASLYEVHFGKAELALSRFSSCIMLVAYASYLLFQLKIHSNPCDSIDEILMNDEDAVTEITNWEAIAWLTIGASDSWNTVSFIS
ncbi:hypothetical protein Tco_1030511, partial [Tanacetum coccineum]